MGPALTWTPVRLVGFALLLLTVLVLAAAPSRAAAESPTLCQSPAKLAEIGREINAQEIRIRNDVGAVDPSTATAAQIDAAARLVAQDRARLAALVKERQRLQGLPQCRPIEGLAWDRCLTERAKAEMARLGQLLADERRRLAADRAAGNQAGVAYDQSHIDWLTWAMARMARLPPCDAEHPASYPEDEDQGPGQEDGPPREDDGDQSEEPHDCTGPDCPPSTGSCVGPECHATGCDPCPPPDVCVGPECEACGGCSPHGVCDEHKNDHPWCKHCNPGTICPPIEPPRCPHQPCAPSPPPATGPVVAPPPPPPAVCRSCQWIKTQIGDIEDKIAGLQRQIASLNKYSDLSDPRIQGALRDLRDQIAALRMKDERLRAQLLECEQPCVDVPPPPVKDGVSQAPADGSVLHGVFDSTTGVTIAPPKRPARTEDQEDPPQPQSPREP
jgi:hypothetical protein